MLGTLLEFCIRWVGFNEASSIIAFFDLRKIALVGGALDSALIYMVLIMSFAAISIGLRSQRQQQQFQAIKQQLTQSRLDALQSQLQPHFLFNTLNGVVAAIHNQPFKAESMVTQLASILRFSLDTSKQQTVPLTDEFHVLEDYLKIEKARLGERISFEISMTPHCQLLHVPPLICQPLVENAVRHGIAPFNRPGKVRIGAGLDSDGQHLSIIIEDSGVVIDKVTGDGVGLSNCESRLEALFGDSATLRFSQSSLGGTKVELSLPVIPSSIMENAFQDEDCKTV